MNNNILCCVECLTNNTKLCTFCDNYNNNYRYKLKNSDKIMLFRTFFTQKKIFNDNDKTNTLSIYFDHYYLKKLCDNLMTNEIVMIGLNNKFEKIKIVCYHDYEISYKINFISFPENITSFTCNYTNTNKLDNLQPSLRYLNCSNNLITNLENLPLSLKYLNCSYNKIKYLDNLADGLEYLDCSHNNIESLDNLPNSIQYLFTINNNIKNFLSLPNNLVQLNSAIYSDNKTYKKCVGLLQKFNYTMAIK